MNRDVDDLTPLDARNSLLLERPGAEGKMSTFSIVNRNSLSNPPVRANSPDRYMAAEEGYNRPSLAPPGGPLFRFLTPAPHHGHSNSVDSQQSDNGYRQPQPVDPYGQSYMPSYGNGGGYRGA